MFMYEGKEYVSKAAVIRSMYDLGVIQNNPHDKNMMARNLGITVQNLHATLSKQINSEMKKKVVPQKSIFSSTPVNKIYFVNDDVRQLVTDQYDKCYEIAKANGYKLPKIEIRFDLKGTVAGIFNCQTIDGIIYKQYFRVNLELAKRNTEEYLKQTIPHEFSHYIVKSKFSSAKPHGSEWQHVMTRVFGRDPLRCHSYDVSAVRRTSGPTYLYKCDCMEHPLSLLKHKRILLGLNYRCRRCNSRLTFAGNK